MKDRLDLRQAENTICSHLTTRLAMGHSVELTRLQSPTRNRLALVRDGDSRVLFLKLYLGRFARERAGNEIAASAFVAQHGFQPPDVVLTDALGEIAGVPWVLFESLSSATTLESALGNPTESLDRLLGEYGALPSRFAKLGMTHFGELYQGAPRFETWPDFLVHRLMTLLPPSIDADLIPSELLANSIALVRRCWYQLEGCTPCFVHGDLHPRNILVGARDEHDTSVVCDLEMAIGGCSGWELVQIGRGFVSRFPQWANIVGSPACGHYGDGTDPDSNAIRAVYEVVEAAEGWVWRADGGWRRDVVHSALAVSNNVEVALHSI